MWNIETYTELPSTQKLAKEKLQNGTAKNGDVIAALHQTEGRGRYADRVWLDELGANLLMSVILTEIPNHLQDKMQFLTALSIQRTLQTQLAIRSPRYEEFDIERVQMKWPNDVLIDGKKISGIVADAVWSGEIFKGIVIGIGLNVNQDKFPENLNATSMKLYTGSRIPVERTRSLVLSMLQFSLEYYTPERLIKRLREELEWMKNTSFSLLEPDGTKFEGLQYEDITPDGELMIRTPDGEVRIFQSGSLQFS